MNELKWTDQDMIDFGNWFCESEIGFNELKAFQEDKIKNFFNQRIENLTEMLHKVDNEDLLNRLEDLILLNISHTHPKK
jgi:hypothetical protein